MKLSIEKISNKYNKEILQNNFINKCFIVLVTNK